MDYFFEVDSKLLDYLTYQCGLLLSYSENVVKINLRKYRSERKSLHKKCETNLIHGMFEKICSCERNGDLDCLSVSSRGLEKQQLTSTM